jgi:hypothetical protein
MESSRPNRRAIILGQHLSPAFDHQFLAFDRERRAALLEGSAQMERLERDDQAPVRRPASRTP